MRLASLLLFAVAAAACASEPPPRPTMLPVVRIPWPLRRHALPKVRPAPGTTTDGATTDGTTTDGATTDGATTDDTTTDGTKAAPDVSALPSATPDAAPSTAPSAAPSANPSTAPNAGPGAAPGAMPSATTSVTAALVVTASLREPRLRNPMPGAVLAGYAGDTGLDLLGSPRTVHALAAARVDYAEKGHTRWVGPGDTPFCVRLALDEPIAWKGRKITHVYYAHLSALAFEQAETATTKRHVMAGEPLGTSGRARGVPHLHLGLLLDGRVEQDDWTYILREGEVRAALGGYGNGEALPKG